MDPAVMIDHARAARLHAGHSNKRQVTATISLTRSTKVGEDQATCLP